MKLISALALLSVIVLFTGCGKSDLEIEKEKIRQQALELQQKIDSTQNIIDSERVSLDSLMYKVKKDSGEIDSMMKKIKKLK
ncbi:MAG: hypothetical protein KDD00_12370 [Ignavibacteriae bacterium]|nr:hypothetical protein [Ignavibacteriota bacterium]